jgi:tRNA pseudouridine55 synthase
MARRRKGQAVSGWVVIDKPAGVTSTQVVAMVRRAFDAQKAGHAGTLDPAATGVLAVALGEATKTVPHITDAMKAYRFTIRLGQSTTTDDAEGTVLATSDARPETAAIEAALAGFRGDIEQVPPQFSAVKVEGERAYDIARAGEEMELAARPLHVAKLDLIARPDADHVDLEMVCGKGGYVRAIARDLGAALGCHGHVLALRRIWSGPFRVEEGITPEALLALDPDARDAYLHPLERGLHDLPEVTLSDEGAVRLRNGNPGAVLIAPARPGDTVWGSYKGQPVAVGTYLGGMLHPSRVFNL